MFPERLKQLRESKGLSQEEMGKYLGITRQAYGKYEKGTSEPDHKTLVKLSKYFSVTTDFLLGKSDTPSLTEKDERDIAKRMKKLREDLTKGDGLSFHGEPLSEEAIESLLEAIEYAERIATRINKKYIPKKHRDKTDS